MHCVFVAAMLMPAVACCLHSVSCAATLKHCACLQLSVTSLTLLPNRKSAHLHTDSAVQSALLLLLLLLLTGATACIEAVDAAVTVLSVNTDTAIRTYLVVLQRNSSCCCCYYCYYCCDSATTLLAACCQLLGFCTAKATLLQLLLSLSAVAASSAAAAVASCMTVTAVTAAAAAVPATAATVAATATAVAAAANSICNRQLTAAIAAATAYCVLVQALSYRALHEVCNLLSSPQLCLTESLCLAPCEPLRHYTAQLDMHRLTK
jgi:hypothetical protein